MLTEDSFYSNMVDAFQSYLQHIVSNTDAVKVTYVHVLQWVDNKISLTNSAKPAEVGREIKITGEKLSHR